MSLVPWVAAPKMKKKAAYLDGRRKKLERELNVKRALKGLPPIKT